ncbi:alpha-galactosidase [Paenibacillus rhizosphaerae]|uniref:Alpha-galactosidase n=1 Tax=Paenibacillus rhizosphaerae TaxID=297318 RepID=A0A839TFV5_9BACL|nr:hypothetical protein [Paenibacillus rhizosphaerae]MBB3125373.1 alpha-galactosidase [Paenibacillus rhizosphaerae]
MDFNIFMTPSLVLAETDQGWEKLVPTTNSVWSSNHVEVTMNLQEPATSRGLYLESKELSVHKIRIRWKHRFTQPVALLGDHWERGYGDMGWYGLQPERVMPWYFMIHDGSLTAGFGVKTGAKSLCYWQVDLDGITLTADVSSGNQGVILGKRILKFAELVQIHGNEETTPYETTQMLCSLMCDNPVMPSAPVYGGNNWYYAYGKSTQEEILKDARFMSRLAGIEANRPFMVIDDCWQLGAGVNGNGGPWIGNRDFPDMAELAYLMKQEGVKPGIWCRPLLTHEKVPQEWVRYTREGHYLDPSHPGVLEYISQFIGRISDWGYELIKHDFSTYDMFGNWGKDMRSRVNDLNVPLFDRSRTSAEIITGLYRTIKDAAGGSLIIGCNTVGHLAAGLFEIQRTGDDTSGRSWERTRRMGVNTLAFRMPQHGTFFAHDADCVGITREIPWDLNSQWLSLLANSGTPLFVSVSPEEATKEQIEALKQAFARAAKPAKPAIPLDWMYNTCPSQWLIDGKTVHFEWIGMNEKLLPVNEHEWWE